jgi:hypothetical protein
MKYYNEMTDQEKKEAERKSGKFINSMFFFTSFVAFGVFLLVLGSVN